MYDFYLHVTATYIHCCMCIIRSIPVSCMVQYNYCATVAKQVRSLQKHSCACLRGLLRDCLHEYRKLVHVHVIAYYSIMDGTNTPSVP